MRNRISLQGVALLSSILLLGLAVPGMAKKPSGNGNGGGAGTSCTNIPVEVTIAPVLDTSMGGIYGYAGSSAAATYTDGQESVRAKLNICDSNNELLLNLSKSTLFYYVDFDGQLEAPYQSGAVNPSPGTYKATIINVHQLANLSDYSQDPNHPGSFVLNTCMSGNVTGIGKRLTTSIHFSNQGLWEQNNGICPDATMQKTSDDNGNTNGSVIQVTTDSNCSQWTVTPVPLAAGSPNTPDAEVNQDAVGLVEVTSNNTYYFGGNYNMPFTLTVTRLDNGGCTGLTGQLP